MEDVQMTVFGWVGTDPEFHSGQGNGDRATFRLASTPRFFDRSRGGYRDRETVWLGVKTWRGLAHNVASSVHKGDPVVVVGRLRAQVYKVDREERRYQELEATSVGHDLTKGTSMFRRTTRSSEESETEAADPVRSLETVSLRPVESVEPVELRPVELRPVEVRSVEVRPVVGVGAAPEAQPGAA